uniref:35.6 kDa salivary apyrase n=1 Tax=Phlebotomus sergenti TaxID=85759 RepID=F6K8J6_9DIPT
MFLKFCALVFATFLSINLSEGAPQGGKSFNFAIIADLDKKSISKTDANNFKSIIKSGELTRVGTKYDIVMKNNEDREIFTKYAYRGRGAELSEFLRFNCKLYSFDDKSGIVFQLKDNADLVPWVVLANGDGNQKDGFKAEWATAKDGKMYVGSTGISWTDKKGIPNTSSLWIKEIDKRGQVQNKNWGVYYEAVKKAMNIPNGFVWHEAVNWSPIKKQWVFLPRKCSELPYNTETEENIGCNKIIIADAVFKTVKSIQIDKNPIDSASGFSSFKFLPDTNDQILIALKTVEKGDKNATYITVIDINGKVLWPEKVIHTINTRDLTSENAKDFFNLII